MGRPSLGLPRPCPQGLPRRYPLCPPLRRWPCRSLWSASCLYYPCRSSIIRRNQPAMMPFALGFWRWRSPAPRDCGGRSRVASRSGRSRSSSGTGRGCPPRSDGGPTFYVRSPRAAAHVLRAPGQLGLGRAYVSGDLEVDDMDAVIGLLDSWKPPPLERRRQDGAAARGGASGRLDTARRGCRPRSCGPAAIATPRSATRGPSATTTTSPTSSSRSSSTTR